MVRFIIPSDNAKDRTKGNLHSNMVRFIINRKAKNTIMNNIFTFQYG